MYLVDIICGLAVLLSLTGGESASWIKETAENVLSHLKMDIGLWPHEAFRDVEDRVFFHLYTKRFGNTPQHLEYNNPSCLAKSDFDATRKTLVVIHGYKNTFNSPITQAIKDAALEFSDFNVIAVDWDYYTRNFNYAWTVSSVQPVGNYVGKFIEFLMEHGLSRTDLHLIGHSLGAHAAGFAGKRLRANGHPADRITGLDAAFPGFYNLEDAENRLNGSDADYVDCIHTCGGMLGIPVPICQADFYPNRGQNVQPGCSHLDLGICSHGRSFEFFAESFNSKHLFKAETCKRFVKKALNTCQDEGVLMGYPAGAARSKGMFSLTTNSHYPFAKTVEA